MTFRSEYWAAQDAESSTWQELRVRCGVEVNETGAEPTKVHAALAHRERTRGESQELEKRARSDQDVAAGLTVTDEAPEALEAATELEEAPVP